MPPRPCIQCGTPTTKTRCPACQAQRDHIRNQSRTHYQGDWDTLSRHLRADHVATHGWTCPGWNRPPHPATDLVVDHVIPRSRAELAVLCRSCNSSKGNTTP